MNLKFRLSLMNFLQFAVWGAYLTCMGNYLDFLVLCYPGYSINLHAHHHRNNCRPQGATSAYAGYMPPVGWRVHALLLVHGLSGRNRQ